MYVGLHEVGHGGVHEAVPLERRQAAKRLGHDLDAKMPLTAGGARMPRMPVTLILDVQLQGREAALQTVPQALFARHGPTLTGADFTLPLNHSTWGIMKASSASVTPKK